MKNEENEFGVRNSEFGILNWYGFARERATVTERMGNKELGIRNKEFKILEITFMNRYILILAACWLMTGSVSGQNEHIGFGFRAGASIAMLDGPSEIGPDGAELEQYSMTKGFHIGASVSYKFTDLVGLRAEFMYSQRGTKYDYNGPSYYVLGRGNVLTNTISGTRVQTLDVSNTYLDIPLMAYYKFGSFELAGGINTGLLISSSAGGSTDFTGVSSLGTPVAPFEVILRHNYKKDEAGGASEELQNVVVDGRTYTVPETVYAYYEFETRDKDQYETFDFGLVGCASFYVNDGLFFSVRYIHGLNDEDRNDYDVSLQSLKPDGSFHYRTDVNKSRAWQFSVGFSF